MAPLAWPGQSTYLPLVPLAIVATTLLLLGCILRFKRKSSRYTDSDTSLQTRMFLGHDASTEILLSETEAPPPYPGTKHGESGSCDSERPTFSPTLPSEAPLHLARPENSYQRYTRTPDVEEIRGDLTLGVCWGVAL